MIFNRGYYHPMDREYEVINSISHSPEKNIGAPLTGTPPESIKFGLGPQEIGTSTLMKEAGAQSLQSRIFHGASKVELAFMGAGKGHREALTPESFGKDEREAIRQLGRINKVQTTTHAAVGIAGVSGLAEGKFDDNTRQQTVHEIKKAIDFAADATSGGSVTFHSSEFPRPVSERGKFEMYPGESFEWKEGKLVEKKDKKIPIYLADSKTGKIISIPKDQKIYVAETWKDPITGREAIKFDANKKPILIEKTYDQIIEDGKKDPAYRSMKDHEIFLHHFYDQQIAQEEGEALRRAVQLDHLKEELVEAEKFKKFVDTNFPLTEKSKLSEWQNIFARRFGERAYRKSPEQLPQMINDQVKELELNIKGNEQIVKSHYEKVDQIRKDVKNYDTIENVGMHKTSLSIAEAAIYAMKRTDEANKKFIARKEEPIKPIYVAPENLFPESYGSHPDELKNIIQSSRNKMIEMLKSQGYDQKAAETKAKTHIKATFDIGHLNIWRKYWVEDPKKSIEDNDKEFRNWVIEKVKKLVKEDVVGHIHIADNLGFHDEHLDIGRGTAPIKEFLQAAKEAGLTDIIVESGSTNFDKIWPEALAELGSPIYAAGNRIPYNNPEYFSQIRHKYHGSQISPYTVVEPYAPSEDWRNWSGIGFE